MTMAPLTAPQIMDRMREVDNDLVSIGNEYGDCAAAKTAAEQEREEAFANAYDAAEGNSIDRRQAAVKAVGSMAKAERVAYAKIAADFELRHTRQMGLASLLKAAKRNDEDPRYHDGP